MTNCKKVDIFKIKDQKIFVNKNSNYLISRENKSWVEFEISIKEISLDETLCKNILKVVYETFKIIPKIRTSDPNKIIPKIRTSDPNESQIYRIQFGGKIEAAIGSLITKYFYDKNAKIFDFISELLFRLTNAHEFTNGNKRTAIVSISKILQSFGYYLTWRNNKETYIEKWEEFMVWVASYREKKNISEKEMNEIINKIREKILLNIWLDAQKITAK